MTRDEYIAMKQAGQLTLPCFYQYYVDNIEVARDNRLRSFEEFGAHFPGWFDNYPLKDNSVRKVEAYFDGKFGLVKIDTTGPGNWNPFNLYTQNNRGI